MFVRYNDEHVPLVEVDPIDRDFTDIEIARVFVHRPLLDEDDVSQGETEILVVESTTASDEDAEFGGVLRNIDRQGAVTELIVESFERYAKDAIPTDGGERWENVEDTVIVEDALDNIPQLEAGTIENVSDEPITLVFSHSSQARKIREVQETTGAEIRYNPDKTLDFLNERGEDRTDEVTLSPDNQNIVEGFEADKISGDEDITHLRVVGAGEGRHQQQVNFVPESDSTNWEDEGGLDNVVRYEADHWDEGDRFEWTVKADKDQTDVNSLEAKGRAVIEDVQNEEIEVTCDVEGVDLSLGDRVLVTYEEEQVFDLEVRVVELEETISSNGVTDSVKLSTRRVSRVADQGERDRKDLGSYNLAFEGTPVNIARGGGRQPVDDDPDKRYEFSFYYPDEVKFEHRVKLNVRRLAYRAYSQGAASSGGSHSHSVSISDHDHDVEVAIPDHRHPINSPADIPVDELHTWVTFPEEDHNHEYELPPYTRDQLSEPVTTAVTSEDGGGTTTTSSSTTPSHTHEPEPGLQEFNEFASNCDVIVNGNFVDTIFESSEDQEIVDLRGELNPGAWNDIEITSDTLGHLQASVDIDVYRQILGDG